MEDTAKEGTGKLSLLFTCFSGVTISYKLMALTFIDVHSNSTKAFIDFNSKC